ncbi:MAG: AzlC family ABC transporter permease [Betaproteobacteria bacterium]|nr:AzlC family ABC transporter permease [Betaproteobacteria bacterium]
MTSDPPPPPSPATPAREWLHGVRDTVPMLVGAAPFGLIFGTLAAGSGLSGAGAMAMSAFVFAGSAQFIALTLLAGGAGLLVIVFTTFVVNLRHLLYAATLLPHVARLPRRWRLPLAFWLTDETFAVVQHRYATPDGAPHKHWYYLGSCLSMYLNWLAWTAAGVLLGRGVPELSHLGLEFAMAATFTAMVVPMLRNRPTAVSAFAAAAVALAERGLPYKLALLLAALSGVAVGVWLDERGAMPADERSAGA